MKQAATFLATIAPAVYDVCRSLIGVAARIPGLRHVVVAMLDARSALTPLGRHHPFDLEHGVRTSGSIPNFALAAASSNAYAAAQPSIIRQALMQIPDVPACHFVDLGCGKGRPLLVAEMCGFKAVSGVELSPTLARIAGRNARALARRCGREHTINVVCGDAAAFDLPADDLVLFFYNPFSNDVMERVVASIEKSLERWPRTLYVIYYNPVAASLFDGCPALERIYAAQLPYDVQELGFGPDRDDAVVIWCNRGNPCSRRSGNRFDRVRVLSPMRAVVERQD